MVGGVATRGVHFALSHDEEAALRAADDPEAALEIIDELEERWDDEWLAESDKAWDALHRTLTDGTLEGESVAGAAILGGIELGDEDAVASLVTRDEVPRVAEALLAIDEATFRERYLRLCPGYHPNFGEEDLAYTWESFVEVRALFVKAAGAGRAVVFSAG